jgi:hypothetical protein
MPTNVACLCVKRFVRHKTHIENAPCNRPLRKSDLGSQNKMDRMAEVVEMAKLMAFLVSEDNSYMTDILSAGKEM